jgi:hypothetical protein
MIHCKARRPFQIRPLGPGIPKRKAAILRPLATEGAYILLLVPAIEKCCRISGATMVVRSPDPLFFFWTTRSA